MINYNNGKIYKIESINGDEVDIYIGSTTKIYLCHRMAQHKYAYRKYETSGMCKCNSFKIFDKYGLDNCIITLLETVKANSKDELLSRESYYIRTLECVNRTIPDRTRKEYIEYNKEAISKYQKVYRENNKDNIMKYREKNKERISEKYKFICECGLIYNHKNRSRHEKTKKHIDKLNSLIL